jgi:hypothetical protein
MTNADAAQSAPKKERSPSFPYIGLTKAIERAGQVYAHARRHEARVADVAAAWGMAPKSSSTLQTIAALLAYGLLEDQGSGDARKLKVTDLGFKALEDQRPGARESALSEAAWKPKLIAEYLEKWREGRPADGICISELRIDRGFTDDGAKAFLRVFDDTRGFTTAQAPDNMTDTGGEAGRQEAEETGDKTPKVNTPPPPSPKPQRQGKGTLMEGERELTTGLLSKDASFRLIVTGQIGVKEIDRLIAKLQIDKEILAEPDAPSDVGWDNPPKEEAAN